MSEEKEMELKLAREAIAVIHDVKKILVETERRITDKLLADKRYDNRMVRNLILYIKDQIPKLIRTLNDEETAIRNWYHIWDDEGTGD